MYIPNCFRIKSIAASKFISCSKILANSYTAGRWFGSAANAFSTRGLALVVDNCSGSFIRTIAYKVSPLGELLRALQACVATLQIE